MQKKPPPRTFWGRLKEALRDARKPTTQKYAATFAQVSQPSVSLWNKPNGVPELAKGISMATRLNVCVEWLYTGRGPKNPPIPNDEQLESRLSLWPRLDDEMKRDLVGYARLRVKPADQDPFPVSDEAPLARKKAG